jgi:hypothetical protein
VTELLYQKHTQLERMAAEKAAQQLTMEREIATACEHAERNHRSAVWAPKVCCSETQSFNATVFDCSNLHEYQHLPPDDEDGIAPLHGPAHLCCI